MKNDRGETFVKRLIDMNAEHVLGDFPWQMIFDMEELDPEHVNSELIILTRGLLAGIPAEWSKERKELLKYLGNKKEVYLGVSHIFQEGREYAISGRLGTPGGPLGFHKITFYDYQRIFDHYITSIITDKNGEFKFSFDRSFLHHHHRYNRKMPLLDLVLKIFEWKDKSFRLIEEGRKFKTESLNWESQNNNGMTVDLGNIYVAGSGPSKDAE